MTERANTPGGRRTRSPNCRYMATWPRSPRAFLDRWLPTEPATRTSTLRLRACFAIGAPEGNGPPKGFQVVVAVRAPRSGIGRRIPLALLAQATSVLSRVNRPLLVPALVDGSDPDSRA